MSERAAACLHARPCGRGACIHTCTSMPCMHMHDVRRTCWRSRADSDASAERAQRCTRALAIWVQARARACGREHTASAVIIACLHTGCWATCVCARIALVVAGPPPHTHTVTDVGARERERSPAACSAHSRPAVLLLQCRPDANACPGPARTLATTRCGRALTLTAARPITHAARLHTFRAAEPALSLACGAPKQAARAQKGKGTCRARRPPKMADASQLPRRIIKVGPWPGGRCLFEVEAFELWRSWEQNLLPI